MYGDSWRIARSILDIVGDVVGCIEDVGRFVEGDEEVLPVGIEDDTVVGLPVIAVIAVGL